MPGLISVANGTPTNGTSSNAAGIVGVGDIVVDRLTGKMYENVGTLASPTFVVLSTFAQTPFRYVGEAQPATNTTGTDTACTNGTIYVGAIFLGSNCTITGLSYLIGSVGGTDKVISYLFDSTGAVVANSALAGATVGTTATMQRVDFTAAYTAPAGLYYAGVVFNGTTAKFRTHTFGDHPAGQVSYTFGTSASITVPTTFTASKAPYAMIY